MQDGFLGFLFRKYHSLRLFNPWLNLNNYACHYFCLSHKALSISWSFFTETNSIDCTCKHSKLPAEELQTLRRWFVTPHLASPVFISLLWILNCSLKQGSSIWERITTKSILLNRLHSYCSFVSLKWFKKVHVCFFN